MILVQPVKMEDQPKVWEKGAAKKSPPGLILVPGRLNDMHLAHLIKNNQSGIGTDFKEFPK